MPPAHQNAEISANETKARGEEDKSTLCAAVELLYADYDTTECLSTPWNIVVFFFLRSL